MPFYSCSSEVSVLFLFFFGTKNNREGVTGDFIWGFKGETIDKVCILYLFKKNTPHQEEHKQTTTLLDHWHSPINFNSATMSSPQEGPVPVPGSESGSGGNENKDDETRTAAETAEVETRTGAEQEEETPVTSTSTSTSTYEQDQQTRAQLEAIEKEIKSKQPLTSNLQPISTLLEIYEGGGSGGCSSSNTGGGVGVGGEDNFIKGSRYLTTKYTSWRMIRGDGNCYYRAFLYAVCEELLRGCFGSTEQDNYKKELKRLEAYGT